MKFLHSKGYAELAVNKANPIVVHLRRGELAESFHRGSWVVVDVYGTAIDSRGDVDRRIYPNSAVKMLQALPFIETGAADRYACSRQEIVLSASSHIGLPIHVEALRAWMVRIGLSEDHLQCGTTVPFSREANEALIRTGQRPSPLHNNSAGKHLAILSTAMHLGEPLNNYLAWDHPAQMRIREIFMRVGNGSVAQQDVPPDRCGAPSTPISLRELALCMARIGTGVRLPASLAAASASLLEAIRNEPTFLVGPGRLSSTVCSTTKGRVIVKGGKEGVYCAVDVARGLGYALKIDDGAGRAADVAIAGLLGSSGALSEVECSLLARFLTSKLKSHSGFQIGLLEVPSKSKSA